MSKTRNDVFVSYDPGEIEVEEIPRDLVERRYKEILKKHRPKILSTLVISPSVINVMKSEKLFTSTMFLILQAERPERQASRVLEMVEKSGANCFIKFIKVLRLTLHGTLADLLRADLNDDHGKQQMQRNVEVFLQSTSNIGDKIRESTQYLDTSHGKTRAPSPARSQQKPRQSSSQLPVYKSSSLRKTGYKTKLSQEPFVIGQRHHVVRTTPRDVGRDLTQQTRRTLEGMRQFYDSERKDTEQVMYLLRQEENFLRELFSKNKKQQEECLENQERLGEIKLSLDQVAYRNEQLRQTDVTRHKSKLQAIHRLL